jgi:rubrerythrin
MPHLPRVDGRNKYSYFASQADKEGYKQIAAIFRKPPITKRNMPNYGLSF